MSLYLFPFLVSFFSTVLLIFVILILCKRFNAVRVEDEKYHDKNTGKICRLGGLAIIFGFSLALIFDINLFITQKIWGVIIVSFFILIFGIYDDYHKLSWRTQLLLHISVALLIFIFGVRVEYITNPIGGILMLDIGKFLLPSLFFLILYVIIMINSMNWLDGIDGLSGGVSFIGALTIFFLTLKPEVNQPPVGIIAMALAGSILGFIIFNFYPSKIVAGTSGSVFMGFILAVLSIFAGTKIATAVLIMSVPLIDAIWVIGERLRAGVSIVKPDNRHLHYKLMDLGWPERKIALFFYAISICIAIVALNTRATGKIITLVATAVIMGASLFFITKRLKNIPRKNE